MKNQKLGSSNTPLSTLAVVCSSPATPASGDPVLWGGVYPGVACLAEDADGETVIALGPGGWLLNVSAVDDSGASAVAHGNKLYYTAGDEIKLSKKASGIPFGIAYSTSAYVKTGNLIAAGSSGNIIVVLFPGVAMSSVTLSAMADLSRGSLIVGGVDDRPAALDAKGDAKILVGDGTDLKSVAVSGDVTMTNAGAFTIGASKITAAKAVASQSVTATADGLTTGLIAALTTLKTFVAVTSDGAAKAVTLPAASAALLGAEVFLTVGANGYELLTPADSNNTINQVDSDGTNQLDVAADTTLRCTCISATGWLAEQIAASAITVVAPDND